MGRNEKFINKNSPPWRGAVTEQREDYDGGVVYLQLGKSTDYIQNINIIEGDKIYA